MGTDLLASLGSKGKNRNSLACLRNAGYHFAITYCNLKVQVRALMIVCGPETEFAYPEVRVIATSMLPGPRTARGHGTAHREPLRAAGLPEPVCL